jgi:transcriptional regulator with XRE-family HTH domain
MFAFAEPFVKRLAFGFEVTLLMARGRKPPAMGKRTKSRGFVREWMMLAGLKQAELVNRLGYSKAKANAIWHGEQRLNEDILEEVATLIGARPFELLLHPDTAHHIRRLEALVADAIKGAGTPANDPPVKRRAAT